MAKKKVRASERSLICVIQALVGMKVLVELKNDVTVKGVLDECDLGMNIIIKDAIQETLQGAKSELSLMFIQGRRIRYIHIPKSVNVSDAVEAQRDRVQRADLMYMQAAAGSQASSRRKEGDESDQAKANPI